MKALVGTFNQVKALVGAFSVITNLCIAFVSSSILRGPRGLAVPLQDLPPVLPHRALYLEPLKLLVREPGVHEELVPGIQSIELL